jgi:hypothetical protein
MDMETDGYNEDVECNSTTLDWSLSLTDAVRSCNFHALDKLCSVHSEKFIEAINGMFITHAHIYIGSRKDRA